MKFGRYDYAAFLTFMSYAGCSMVIPLVLVVLAADLGFPLTDGGMGLGGALQLGRSIPMVAAMLLCGFMAGRWGKRRSLGFAVLVMGAGIGLSSLAPGYGLLFAAVAVAGLGEGVIEGLATPLVQDLHAREPGRYINFAHGFWSVGLVVATLGVGYLQLRGVSWRWLVGVTGLLALLPAALLWLPTRRYRGVLPDRDEPVQVRVVWQQFLEVVKRPRFWLFFGAMFLAGGGEFCLTFWTPSFVRLSLGGDAWDGGVCTACFAGGMIVGRLGSGIVVRQHRLRELIWGAAALAILISIWIPLQGSLGWLQALLFVAGIATGPFWPSIQSYCVDRVEGDSTMIYILLSCAGVPGCGFFTWLMGALGDHFGLRVSFYLVGVCFLLMGGLIALDSLLGRRRS